MKTRFLAVIDRKRKSPWFALGVNLMAMLAMTLVMRPSFETNDDIVFAEFGSGLRGVKTPRLVFQNYILGLVYRLLYQVTGRLPWYTIVQYAVLVAAFSAVTYVFMNRLKGYWGLYLSFILLWVFGYESYIHIQFTKTAGIAAAAAVLLLFHVITSEKFCVWETVAGFLLGLTGFMYREDQFFASSALMAGVGIYFIFTLKKRFPGKEWKRFGLCAGIFGMLLLAVFAVDCTDRLMYKNPQWQEYQRFNNLRSELLDYGFPDYESNQTLYQELGISREAYELYRTWNFNDPDKFTTEVMEKLAEQKPEKILSGKVIHSFVKRFPGDVLQQKAFWIVLLLFVLWLFFGKKGYAAWFGLAGELCMLGGLNFYLYFQGRYLVNRVDVGLWFSVCLTMAWLLADSVKEREKAKERSKGKVGALSVSTVSMEKISGRWGLVLCAAVLLIAQSFWYDDWRLTTREIPKARVSQRAVLETIGTDKEHVYLAKSGTVSEIVCYGPFDPMPENLLDNLYWLSGWECRTPGIVKEMREHGITNPYKDMIGNKKVYLIDDNIQLTLDYIRQNYDKNAEAVFVKTLGNVDLYQIQGSVRE